MSFKDLGGDAFDEGLGWILQVLCYYFVAIRRGQLALYANL